MIKFLDKPNEDSRILSLLSPIVGEWFKKKFKTFCLPQKYGVMPIHGRENILISAPTGSGKCITPDSTILLNLGGEARLLTGNELIELAKKGKLIRNIDKSGKLCDIPNLQSYSLNKNQTKKTKAFVYFENYKGKIYKVKTEYGREIKLSPDHPLLIEKNRKEKWVPIKDIKVGEKIAVPKKINLPEKEILLDYKRAIINLKENSSIVITYKDYLRLRNKTNNFNDFKKLNSKELYKIKTLLKTSFIGLGKKLKTHGSVIFRLFNGESIYKKNELFGLFKDKCKKIRFEENRIIAKNKGNQFFSFRYPKKVDVKLARWIAFILAEGLIGDYKKGTHLAVSQKNRTKLLTEFFKNTKEIFDLEFRRKNYKDYAIHSTLFCYFLNNLLDIKRGRGRYIPLPNWLLNAKKEIKSNFLNVFFSLEASNTGREIKISQANQNKIEIIQYMLLSFGIFSSVNKEIKCATNTQDKIRREYFSLTVRKIRNLKLFLKEIDIDHPNKDFIKNQILKKTSGEYVSKHKFNYKKITALSRLYKDYKEFKQNLGKIYEVIRRTGYATETALMNLKNKLQKFKNKELAKNLISEINDLLNKNICWLKINKIEIQNYRGNLVDLIVPNVHNFIGGYGGLYLHNTLTAFLSILNELIDSSEKGILKDKVYCVYISPLKALSRDIEYNLMTPLKEMEEIAGKEFRIRVAVRTGDTTQAEKSRMLKNTPHILITTPESLSILLNSPKFVEKLKDVDWCIVDEIHALAENKRGVHLSLSIERLAQLSSYMTRVGLSATISPLEEIAKFLVGYEDGKERNCKIVDVQFLKKLDIKVLSPVKDLIDVIHKTMQHKMYELLDELIQQHETTLIFTNTRSATERVIHHLKDKFPKNYTENIGAHHGSLSRELRTDIEERLRQGKLKCIVSSTSLELGIDIGYIDLVILLSSPKSIARALQRCGRSGHKFHDTTKGRLVVMDRDDLIECSVIQKYALEKKIDKIHIPTNCLDVLAQQIYGIAIAERMHIDDLYNLVKRSYCYKNLNRQDFIEVLEYLAGSFTSLEDRHVYAKIWYDEETGLIGRKGKMARVLYMTNIGTIPDETFVKVKIGEKTIGNIDEGFLERLKRGDIFVLGGQVYEFLHSRGMVAQVRASPNRPPTIPSWFSDMLPLSFDLALGIQKFRKLISQKFENKRSKQEILSFINEYLYVEDKAAEAIYNYFKDQHDYIGIPNEEKIIIENYIDEYDKKFTVFHTLYGRRVNDVLSRALAFAISRSQHRDVQVGITDNGFYLTCEKTIQPLTAFKLLNSKELRQVMKLAIENSEVLKRRFRHCATRAMMILREYKGHKKRVGRQQVSSMLLLNAVRRISENFSILKEARREVLEDLMDTDNAIKVLEMIEQGKIKVEETETRIPSPFALNLVVQGRTDIMKADSKQEFLKRMHNLLQAKLALKQEKK